jgi:hypothetical protein
MLLPMPVLNFARVSSADLRILIFLPLFLFSLSFPPSVGLLPSAKPPKQSARQRKGNPFSEDDGGRE